MAAGGEDNGNDNKRSASSFFQNRAVSLKRASAITSLSPFIGHNKFTVRDKAHLFFGQTLFFTK